MSTAGSCTLGAECTRSDGAWGEQQFIGEHVEGDVGNNAAAGVTNTATGSGGAKATRTYRERRTSVGAQTPTVTATNCDAITGHVG